MSLTASLASVGRAVAYFPRLSKFFGSVNASIFFSQLHYWHSRASDERGVFKTAEEWTEETGLSYREQVTARKILTEKGFLVETHKRLQHRVYYKLDLYAVDAAFDAWDRDNSSNDENAFRERRKAQSGERVSSISGSASNAVGGTTKAQSVNKTETTTETTAEKKTVRVTAPAIPAELLSDFLAVRKAKKAGPLTPTALAGLQREADKAGVSLEVAVTACCEYGWQSFHAGWYAERTAKTPASAMTASRSSGQTNRHAGAAAAIWGNSTQSHGDFIDV